MTTDSLQQFVESVSGTSRLRIEEDFGGGFVRLMTSEAERRQAAQDIRSSEDIVLELLRNSRDAHASRIYIAMSKEGNKRLLTALDDGDGIPQTMQSLVFEPRVTSKLDTSHSDAWGYHGRGMALYSISVNAEKAYVAASGPDLGTAIHIVSDTTKLAERTDQSSFPTFDLVEPGKVNVRGPRNLLRTICEFALDCRASCSVYVGSPAEVCASLYAYGMATLSVLDRLFCDDHSQIPLVKRFATAADPLALASIASDCGLNISERTARRIMDGELSELDPVLQRITITSTASKGDTPKKVAAKRSAPLDARSVKLTSEDKQELKDAVMRAYEDIAQRHYLEAEVGAEVGIRGERLVISIPLVKTL